jgi:uncharacterized membrane protein YsdA (DUF1294 family)
MISIDITSEPFHVCSIQYMFTIMDKKEAQKRKKRGREKRSKLTAQR